MKNLHVVSILILMGLLLIEGVGFGREFTYNSLLLIPSMLCLAAYSYKIHALHVPKKFILLGGLFVLTLLISTIFSVDRSRSIADLAYWIVVLVLSMFVVSGESKSRKLLIKGVSGIALFFSLMFLLNRLFPSMLSFVDLRHGYSFIADPFRANNSLGTFLVPVLCMLFPVLLHTGFKKNKELFLFLFLFMFFITSGTRAAYIGFAVTIGAYIWYMAFVTKNISIKKIIFSSLLVLIPLILFFLTATLNVGPSWLTKVSNEVVSVFNAPQYESLLSSREYYFRQAIMGFIEKPLIGWGPGNMYYASLKFAQTPILTTFVSENIILDTLAEVGILGTLAFLLVVGILFRSAWITVRNRNRDITFISLSLAGLSIAVMMMGDSIKWWYGFFLLFFVLLFLLYNERERIRIPMIIIDVVAVLILIYINQDILGKIAITKGHFLTANIIAPWNRDSYIPLLMEFVAKGDESKITNTLKRGDFFFGLDPQWTYSAGRVLADHDGERAAIYIKKSFTVQPVPDFDRASEGYFLIKKLQGTKAAEDFFLTYAQNYITARNFSFRKRIYDVFRDGNIIYFCEEEGFLCRFRYTDDMLVESINYINNKD